MTERQTLRSATTLEQLQASVVQLARESLRADGATFVLRDGDRCFYVDEDAIAPLWKGQRFPMTSCISGWAMLNRSHAAIIDITKDERIPLEAYLPTFVRSLLMVPIQVESPVGAIGAYWADHHESTATEIDALTSLAGETAESIARIGLDDAPWAPSFDR